MTAPLAHARSVGQGHALNKGRRYGISTTGVFRRATDGQRHLGNYLGAIIKFVELQKSHDCIYCVVDLHAITVWQEPAELKQSIRDVTAAFIASGIDSKRHIVFNQSQVAEHAELAWIFNCVARLGWLNRMTQFRRRPARTARTLRSACTPIRT